MQKIIPFLMFTGKAEAAMNFYLALFPGSQVKSISRYGANEAGPAGTVQHALFSLGDQEFMCIDSPVQHAFGFTPAVSLYVACKDEAEITALFAQLSTGGQVLMPLGPYPFAKQYAWVNDPFGVSWQLSLTS